MVHDTYQHTGMGQSFAKAHLKNSNAKFNHITPIYEENSDFYYWPFLKDSLLYVKEFRLADNGDTIHQRTEKISYIVGSGHHTNSHIIDLNGYVYQAPVTYYTQDEKWDMAPSFREQGNLRFSRLLDSECITCHNNFPTQAEGSLNKFTAMPSGIECEQCHGPGSLHTEEKRAGVVVNINEEIDNSIVNPAKLPRGLQMDLCQRCHLQGTAVLEEGKTFYDFKPGMRLNEVANIFLPRFANSDKRFIMASQADRLRQSKCFQKSDMTCLSCHNPHESVQGLQSQHFIETCLQCHQSEGQIQCSESIHNRQEVENKCSTCHMLKSGSLDIAHVSITDHKIQRNPSSAVEDDNQSFYGLEMLTKTQPKKIDMARGYLALYDKYASIPYILDSVKYYLDQCMEDEPATEKAKIHYFFNKNDYSAITQMVDGWTPEQTTDAWTAYRIAEAFYKNSQFIEAFRFIEKATALQPLNLDFLEKKALVLTSLKRYKEAREQFEFILSENPKRPETLCNRGFLYVMQGNFPSGERMYDQAIALDPDHEQALLNKAALLNAKGKKDQAILLILRVLKINPDNLHAQQAMGLFN
jgi:predicted CXXCH cytochrome family protein